VVLFAILLLGLSYAKEEEPVDQVQSGSKFISEQSVSGTGIANSYRYFVSGPLALHSHISGSGAYGYESEVLFQYDISENEIDMENVEYYSTNQEMVFKDIVSAANAAIELNLPGSFRSMPINSLWSDAVCAENIGGRVAIARFDEARSLNKEMVIRTASDASYDNRIGTQEIVYGSLNTSMDLNAAFNGTARLEMIGQPSRKNSRTLIDEVYRGSFSLNKKSHMTFKSTSTTNVDDWLPCCFGGYLTEPTYYQKGSKGFGSNLTSIFDCTCSKLISPADCSQ
jgi:hypothetical protein